MPAAKSVEERLKPCTNPACKNITRPARMAPLASMHTVMRQGRGLCASCYAAERRAATAAARNPERTRPDPALLEEARSRAAAASLDRFMAERRERMARQGRASA